VADNCGAADGREADEPPSVGGGCRGGLSQGVGAGCAAGVSEGGRVKVASVVCRGSCSCNAEPVTTAFRRSVGSRPWCTARVLCPHRRRGLAYCTRQNRP